ncbi:MAG: PTS sugar transporter subunit IIA [Parachlamydia sp.]|nr:PTS sugar transporter subunit IIA [Parachlamydia sp.]
MPMDLKIKDVADLLNVSETTIRRWLTEGKIPAYRLNHQYRFDRTEIEDWVMKKKLSHTPEEYMVKGVSKTPPTNEEKQQTGIRQYSLFRAIHKGFVIKNVPGKTKEEVIRNTMRKIAGDLNLDADVMSELLMDRENLQPTGLGHGIAIPHTRDYLLETGHDIVVVAFPEKPLDYDALDGQPVHTLFFLFACEDKRHLHLLSKIAHLSRLPATIDLLLSKPSKETFLEYIREWESGIHKVQEEARS